MNCKARAGQRKAVKRAGKGYSEQLKAKRKKIADCESICGQWARMGYSLYMTNDTFDFTETAEDMHAAASENAAARDAEENADAMREA